MREPSGTILAGVRHGETSCCKCHAAGRTSTCPILLAAVVVVVVVVVVAAG